MSAKNNVHSGFPSRAEVKILVIFFLLLTAVVSAMPVASTEAVDDWSMKANCSCWTSHLRLRRTATRIA